MIQDYYFDAEEPTIGPLDLEENMGVVTDRGIEGILTIAIDQGINEQTLSGLLGQDIGTIAKLYRKSLKLSARMGINICRVLGYSAWDVANCAAYAGEGISPYIRLHNSVPDKKLEAKVAEYNNPEVRERWLLIDRYPDRCKLLATFAQVIHAHELNSDIPKELDRFEYLKAEPVLTDEDWLKIGDAIVELRRVRDLSTHQLSKLSKVNQPTITRFEHGNGDLSFVQFDQLAQALAVTTDEITYLVKPPLHKWPMFLPKASYANHEMLNLYYDGCNQYKDMTLKQRVEILIDFRNWLLEEEKLRRAEQEANTITPGAFRRLWVLFAMPQTAAS